jgi:hypothetical protein
MRNEECKDQRQGQVEREQRGLAPPCEDGRRDGQTHDELLIREGHKEFFEAYLPLRP